MQFAANFLRSATRRTRFHRAARLAAAASAATFGSAAGAWAGGNFITPDGRTQTQLQNNGNITTITTHTIAGGDAFNSFGNFTVGSGHTVNLVVPTGASHLVNLVWDSPVLINGVLNSVDGGHIGGNVVFVDPQGMIVGAGGTVNVGSLTAISASASFMNTLLNQAGKIDPAAASQLLSGEASLSHDGTVVIAGKINAASAVNLDAANVIVARAATLNVADAARLQKAFFNATVNTQGLEQGSQVVDANGVISIVGSQSAQVAGALHAGGAAGGTVAISGKQVQLTASARVDASGANGGGSIFIGGGPHAPDAMSEAQQVTVAPGAQISANASERGNGGHVVLWSSDGTTFAGTIDARGGPQGGNGGFVEVSARQGLAMLGEVNTTAPRGTLGTLLLDPTDLYIVSSSSPGDETLGGSAPQLPYSQDASSTTSTVSVAELQALGDTNITLQASDAITMGDSAGAATDLNLAATLKTGTLTLEAGTNSGGSPANGAGNIVFNVGSSIETGGGGVVLHAGINSPTGSDTGSSGTVTLGSITTNGGSLTVDAAGAITLPQGTNINTQTSANTVASGGAVDLESIQAQTSDFSSSTTGITINGGITAGDITLNANASAKFDFLDSSQNVTSYALSNIFGGVDAVPLPAVQTTGNATVTIGSTAVLVGGAINATAQTTELSSFNNSSHVEAPVLYGDVSGTATATVASGAHITADTSLSVSAINNDTLNITAYSVSSASFQKFSAALAYGQANIQSTASIAGGAVINTPNAANVSVVANNNNAFTVQAFSTSTSTGNVGIAAAISVLNTNAIAFLGANLGTSNAPVGNVQVLAADITSQETNWGSAGAGSNISASSFLSDNNSVFDYLSQYLTTTASSATGAVATDSGSGGSSSNIQVGASVSVAVVHQGATADIATDSSNSANTAPTINASGNVTVHADTSVTGVQDYADASSTAEAEQQQNGQTQSGNQIAVTAAIALGFHYNTTEAYIGDGVNITAANVGINAYTYVPATVTWNQWSGFSSITSGIQSYQGKLNGNLGAEGQVFTSYAGASASGSSAGGSGSGSSSSTALAGAVDLFDISDTTKAYIGRNATITSTATGETTSTDSSGQSYSWQTALNWNENPLDTSGNNTTLDFAGPVTVSAQNFTQSINMAGNPISIGLSAPSLGTSSSGNGTGIGGGFTIIYYGNNTNAEIGSGTHITVSNTGDAGLSVMADGVDQAVDISPSAGSGSSIAGNGIVSFTDVENTTQAAISNAATVSAAAVNVGSVESLAVWDGAGAISAGQTAGVGIAIAANYLNTNTSAFIGDNSSFFGTSDVSGGGQVNANTLTVKAITSGQAGALGVSGAKASSSSDQDESSSSGPGFIGSAKNWISGKFSSLTNSAAGTVNGARISVGSSIQNIPLLSSISGYILPSQNVQAQSQNPGADSSSYSVAVAGSVTANVTLLDTKAYLDGVTLNGLGAGAVNPTVEAANYTGLISASGGAAFVSAGGSSSSATGVAGAVAFGLIDNTTDAYIQNSSLTNADNINVESLAGGFEATVGLGLAVNTGSSDSNTSVTLSISVPVITNTTDAWIQNSTLLSRAGDVNRAVNVTAYDQTLFGAGGGSFYGGSSDQTGVGAAFTVSVIDNQTSAYLAGVIADGGLNGNQNYDSVNVQGLDAANILSGAVTGGGSENGLSISGAFDANYIGSSLGAYIGSYTPSGGNAGNSNISTTGAVTVNSEGVSTSDSVAQPYNTILGNIAGGGYNSNLSGLNLNANLGGTNSLPLGTANEIIGVSAAIAVGGNSAGLSLTGNIINDSYTAYIDQATIRAGGKVSVTATDNSTIIGFSVGGGVATEGFTGLGSLEGNQIADTTSASIGSTSDASNLTNVTSSGLDVAGSNDAAIWALAGNVGYGSETAIGASIGYNGTDDSSSATIANATINNGSQDASVHATSGSSINSLEIAGGVGGDAAIDGAVGVNLTLDKTTATVSSSNVTTGTLSVKADDPNAQIKAAAGALGVSSDVGVGVGIVISDIGNSLSATISDSAINALTSTEVMASSGGYIGSIGAAVAGSGSVAVNFANSSNNIGNSVTAGISNSSQDNAGNTTTVSATDTSTIKSLAGGLAISGDAAACVATAINRVGTTVHAYIHGASSGASPIWLANDVTTNASSNATIDSLAAGVGASAGVGATGSIAINILTNTATADIDNNAQVTAIDNVGVLALNQNTIQDVAGALAIGATGAGVGLSTAVNYIGGSAAAFVSGSGTAVNALAQNASDALTVDAGHLQSDPSAGNFSALQQLPGDFTSNGAPSLTEQTQSVTGLAINAEQSNTLTQLAFTGALAFDPLGSAAVAGTIDVNVMSGSTDAYINQASINQQTSLTLPGNVTFHLTPGANQQVNVTASTHDYGGGLVLGLAGGATSAAVALTVGVNAFTAQTYAYATGSNISATQGIAINAVSSQDAVGLAAGLSAAIAGVSGTAVVNYFSADTQAYSYGGDLNGGALTIGATSRNSATLVSAAAGVGAVGASGVGLIAINKDNTQAYLGKTGQITTVTTAGAINVTAASSTTMNAMDASVGVGGLGFAGMLTVGQSSNTTMANIASTNIDENQGDPQAAGVNVQATDTLTVQSYAGALGGGGTAGVGGGINVIDISSAVNAGIADSNMKVAGAVAVQATSNRNVQVVTATAGLGGLAGVAGSAGVVIIDGGTPGSDGGYLSTAQGNDSSSISGMNTETSQNFSGNADHSNLNDANGNGLSSNSGSSSNLLDSNGNDISSSISGPSQQQTSLYGGVGNGTTASIVGGSINAGSVSVNAADNTAIDNISGAVGLGGSVGFGSAIAVTELSGVVSASIQGATVQAASVRVSAMESPLSNGFVGQTIQTDAYAGGGSLFVGFGAGVAVGIDNTEVTSSISGNINGNSSVAMTLASHDNSTLNVQSYGFAGGIGALGASISVAHKTSTVKASVGSGSYIQDVASLGLTATDGGYVDASSTAGAVGVVSGNASYANAQDTADVEALINGGTSNSAPTKLNLGSGGLSLTANDTPSASANSFGVSVGAGAGLGASIATAKVAPTVTASSGNYVQINSSGGLTLSAGTYAPTSGSAAYANTVAGSGGLLLGADASVATATDSSEITAQTGAYNTLPLGAISINAFSNSGTDAQSTGVAVGGLALGASASTATSSGVITAAIGQYNNNTTAVITPGNAIGDGDSDNDADAAGGSDSGDVADATPPAPPHNPSVIVQANANDNNTASATAGAGGVVAGDVVVATTSDSAGVSSSVGANSTLVGGAITLAAAHNTTFFASSNSVNASALGASGASAVNNLSGVTSANVGGNTALDASGNLTIAASNNDTENNNNGANDSAKAAGGGIANGSAVTDNNTFTEQALVNISSGDLLIAGTDPLSNPGSLTISASNIINSQDSISLVTGGLLQGAAAVSTVNATETDAVNIGDNTSLISNGTVSVGTYSNDAVTGSAYSSTWGLAGVGASTANVTVSANQSVTLGSNVGVLGYSGVSLTAGMGTGGQISNVAPDAIAQSYVSGLIAIPIVQADATANRSSTLSTGAGDAINSGGDLTLGAYRGPQSAQTDGTAYGFEVGFVPVIVYSNNAANNGNGTINLFGEFAAGYFHNQTINITPSGGTVAVNEVSGAPLVYQIDAAFNPDSYLTALTQNDPSLLAQELTTVSTGTVTAVDLGPLYAAPGNVILHASQITGSGQVAAHGDASINVNNTSDAYLLFDGATIPDTTGGQILYTGTAASVPLGITASATGAGIRSAINIISTSTDPVGTSPTTGSPAPGLAFIVQNSISNIGGLVSITNDGGSLFQTGAAQIAGEQILENIPNGSLFVNTPTVDYNASGNSPYNEWLGYLSPSTPDLAAAYVANSEFGGGNYSSGSSFTYALLGSITEGNIGIITSNREIYPILGNAVPGIAGDNSYNTAQNVGASVGTGAYLFSTLGSPAYTVYYPEVPILNLTPTRSAFPASYATNDASSSVLVGGQIGINALHININGSISSGHITSVNVLLGGSTLGGAIASAQSTGQTVDVTGDISSLGANPADIKATYNPTTNQISITNILASGGGFVYLNGGIANSGDATGSINVNAGFGNVQVINDSGVGVVVNNINAGSEALSEVKIVDQFQHVNGGSPLTTWYVYDVLHGLSVFNNTNGATDLAGAVQVAPPSQTLTANGLTTSYNPLAGLEYQFNVSRNISRSTGGGTVSYDWSWASGWTENSSGYTVGSTSDPQFKEQIGGLFTSYYTHSVSTDTSVNLGTPLTAASLIADGMPDNADYNFPISGTITDLATARVDAPIPINFVGSQTGIINITSNGAPIVLNGQINNPAGSTTIAAIGSTITESPSASIVTNQLTLSGDSGVGTATTPIGIRLVSQLSGLTLPAAPSLSVNAITGGVYVNVDSAVPVAYAKSSGDIVITAQGGITAAPGGSGVQGDNVTLVSQTGGIGTTSSPLAVSVNGVLTATAADSIMLSSSQNLAVNAIASGAGDVSLNVQGNIYNASSETPAQTLSSSQLNAIWSSLGLLQHDSPTAPSPIAVSNAINPYQRLVNTNYQLYWQLLSHGSVNNGTFTLSPSAVASYTPVANAAGYTGSGAAQEYAANKYNQVLNFFQTQFPAGGSSPSYSSLLGTAYNAGFNYTVNAQEQAQLAPDFVWTQGLLTNVLNASAFTPSASNLVGLATPNVSGRNISISASGNIGQPLSPLVVSQQALAAQPLSASDLSAIALAYAPGDIIITGNVNQQQGIITIKQFAPLFVHATGNFTADAHNGPLFVQAAGSLNLPANAISTPTDARLAATQDILAAGTGSEFVSAHQNLYLIAGNGSIGTAATPLAVQTSTLVSAGAGQNVYVSAVGAGDLTLGAAFAANTLSIAVPNGNLLTEPSSSYSGINLAAPTIDLQIPNGRIGNSSTNPLQVNDAPGATPGAINAANVGGEVDIFDPLGNTLGVGAISATGPVNITSAGNIQLGSLTSSYVNATTATFNIAALGAISSASVGTLNLSGPAGSLTTFSAGTGIGAAAIPLLVNLPEFSAATTNGGIYINDEESVTIPNLSAPNGDAAISVTGSLTINNLTVGGNLSLSASSGNITLGNINVTNSLNLHGQNITAVVHQTGAPQPLVANIGGFNGGVANSINLTIYAPSLIFSVLDAANTQLTLSSNQVQVLHGDVPGSLAINTPGETLLLNNTPQPLLPVNVQLYQPGGLFNLLLSPGYVQTDAYVLRYQSGWQDVLLSYIGSHNDTDFAFVGGSIVRDGVRVQTTPFNLQKDKLIYILPPQSLPGLAGLSISPRGGVNVGFLPSRGNKHSSGNS
ncbi:MAG: leukotoxin LktA family filamentous adhesin [Phycisphaerales bacterium]|nr:leukotoxin LktA family filamentous adhesin [Phycisphaerales bacterium]